MRTTSPLIPIFSKKSTSSDNFIPATGALASAGVKSATFGVYLEDSTFDNIKVRPGVQYSDDGITWDTAVAIDLGGTGAEYATDAGWTYKTSFVDLESVATPKVFVRFGFMVLNVSGATVEGGLARLMFDLAPQNGGSLVYGPTKVNSAASSATEVFTPMSEPLEAMQITAVRRALELQASTGGIEIGFGYQVSDDGETWASVKDGTAGTFASVSTTVDTNTIDYDSSYTTVALTTKYVRFGAYAKNKSGGDDVEAGLASIRVDWR